MQARALAGWLIGLTVSGCVPALHDESVATPEEPGGAASERDAVADSSDPVSAPSDALARPSRGFVNTDGGGLQPVAPRLSVDGSCVSWSIGLDGFTVRPALELINDPRAGSRAYAYLERNRDAAQLQGPRVAAADPVDLDALELGAVSVRALDRAAQPAVTGAAPNVFEVLVPGAGELRYSVSSEDFEDEVDLRQVTLCRTQDGLDTAFVFAGVGLGGVAHAVRIQVAQAGKILRATEPIALEVR